jgi:polysaccharide deacetylase 2 family uncharacterized protein YibQ
MIAMGNIRDFTVHRVRGANNFPTQGLPKSLMAKTDTQQGNVIFTSSMYHVETDTCMIWITWARGNDNSDGRKFQNIIDTDLVISIDVTGHAQIAEILNEVVCKAIVIINKNDFHPFVIAITSGLGKPFDTPYKYLMKWNRKQRQKLHIHTTSRELQAGPPPTRGGLPFLAVAIIFMIILTKYVIPDWWFPTPEKYRDITVPIEREAVVEAIPDPQAEPVEQVEPEEEPATPAHMPVWQKNAVPVELHPGKAYVALVIDDMGVNVAKSRDMLGLPVPLTLAFLPYANDVDEMATAGRDRGHELMVHIPMEPLDPTINAGKNVLKTSLSQDELVQEINANLSRFTGYVGINNHMGSRFTQDVPALQELMKVLKERELLLLDSKTIGGSQAYTVAKVMGIPALERDVFLDDDPSLAGVRGQLKLLESVAARKGYAIAIGHPKTDTLQALKEWLPGLEQKNIQIVPISALAMMAWSENAAQSHPQPPAPRPATYEPSQDIQIQEHSQPLSQPLPVYESSHP